MLKYPKIKPNWRIQITAKNPVVFGAPPALNVMATAFLWLQCKFHNILGETKWLPRNFGHFMASGCSETHFCAFSMIWATFCTHQNHCYLCVLFSSQPQSTNFEQNLTRSLHFIGFTFEVGGAYRLTWVWAIAATHWRKRTQIWDQ